MSRLSVLQTLSCKYCYNQPADYVVDNRGSPIREIPCQSLCLHSMGNAGGYTQTKWYVASYICSNYMQVTNNSPYGFNLSWLAK